MYGLPVMKTLSSQQPLSIKTMSISLMFLIEQSMKTCSIQIYLVSGPPSVDSIVMFSEWLCTGRGPM